MKLSDSNTYTIFVIGTGGTGSNLVPYLSLLLNKFNDNRLILIDGDYIESKNLNNQKFREEDINYNKAEILSDRYSRAYPNLKVTFIPEYIKSSDFMVDCILNDIHGKNYVPIIIGCVDNNATRKILHETFYSEQIRDLIYIDSGNGTTERIGQVIVGYRTYEAVQDMKCLPNWGCKYVPKVILKPVGDIYKEILEDNDDINKLLSCANVNQEAPQNVATNVMAATTIFAIVNNIIAFNEIKASQHYFSVDTENVEIISKRVK